MMKLLLLLAFVYSVQGADNPGKCVDCKDPMFNGFGYKPTDKCGCCPWPCCCKCAGAEEPDCTMLIDVALVFDGSGSIGISDWNVGKGFLKDVVGEFSNIGTDQLVAATSYSGNATVQWTFADDETSSKDAFNAAIDGIQRQGAFTNLAEALEKTDQQIFSPSGGDRDDVPNAVVIMTDGKSNFRGGDDLRSVAASLRAKAKLICIGITSKTDDQELADVCGNNVFRVVNFEELRTILKDMQKTLCEEKEKCHCCCSPEQFFGGGGSQYYKY